MKKLSILGLSAVMAGVSLIGCNSETDPVIYTSTNVIVSSFSFSADDSVMKNLDTVFFSIDLQKGRIFNADSLPYGTKINRLVPVIKVYESASALTLTVPRANGTDTVYDYVTHSTDSIDFSNGPVVMTVTSFNGSNSYKYSIEVNVHKEIGDTMVWTDAATAPLATALAAPKAQKTVRNSAGLYTLTGDGTSYSLMHAATPADTWTAISAAVPAGADVNSFTAAGDAFYLIAGGQVYSSTDGSAWTATGQRWSHIYGDYNGHIIGASNASGQWQVLQYPGSYAPIALPDGMPVSGTSEPLSMTVPMAQLPQMMFIGGEKADGTLSNAAWAFDGQSWANITLRGIPGGLKGMTMVPFYVFYSGNTYYGSEQSVILAYGGTNGSTVSRDVYMSPDFGVNWYKALTCMQLPVTVPATYNAQAYVFESVFGGRSASAWQPIDCGHRLPANAVLTTGREYFFPGRATEPVTTWNVPFIYTFGGIKADGSLETSVWKATINRLSFKPII